MLRASTFYLSIKKLGNPSFKLLQLGKLLRKSELRINQDLEHRSPMRFEWRLLTEYILEVELNSKHAYIDSLV